MFKTFFTILLFVLFSGFNSLLAQVTTLTDWTLHTHTTSTAAVNANYTIPVGTNSNRILVVAIASSRTDAGTRTVTVTYGGRALTLASGDMGSASRQHSAIYYLNEAGLDAAVGTTLSVTVATGTTAITDVWYAVFDRVNQVSPITNSQNYNSGTGTVNPIQFSTALTINTNNLALKVISSVRTGNTSSRTISNFGTNWTLTNQQTGSYDTNGNKNDLGISNAIGTRAIPTTNTTDFSSVDLSGGALASMTGVSLNNAPKYFRSVVTTGLWSNLSTWQESFNNSTWVAATTLPTEIDAQVTIQAGNTVTLTGATVSPNLIVNGTLDAATYLLTGTGTLTANNGSNILIGGTANFPTGFTTATLNAGSTVNYNGAAQTVAARNYANLTFSGTNTKTLQTGTTSITGNLTLSGTTSATAVVGLTIGGSVIIGSGTTFNASSFTHLVAGNWTNNGGTFTPATSTITFTGNSSQINGSVGSQTFNNFTVNKTAGQTLSVGGSTTSIIINGTALLTTGIFSAPLTLTLGGNFTNNSNGFIANSGTVSMNGSGFTIGGSVASTFNNLTINNAGGTLLGQSIVVNNSLTLTSGRLTLNAYNMTLGVSALPIAGTFNTSNMIIATSTGQVRKLITSTPFNFTFPIGDNTSVADYSPINISIVSATLAPGALVSVNVINQKHPNNGSLINYLERYWSVNQTGITNMLANVTATFVSDDVKFGTYNNIISSRYVAPEWIEHNIATANTISANSLVAFGDFTGRNNVPVINVTPSTLTDFTYIFGNGPSTQKSFILGGSALTTNITVLPTDTFEISTLSGASFSPSPIITVNVVNRQVAPTTIYVRLKAGFNVGTIPSQKIQCISTGVTNVNVMCSGLVTNAPTISTSVNQLTNFSYRLDSGPSITQSFTVDGIYLLGSIVVTAPTNYEIQSGSSAWGSTLTFSPGQTPAQLPALVNVRLKAGLLVSNYNENIILTTPSGLTQTVRCEGTVNTATVNASKLTLAGFIYTFSDGLPSSVQSFVASGSNLTADLVVTPPTNFEISTDSLTGYTLSAINTAQVGGSASKKIYVRMKAGLPVGLVASQKISVTSSGAITQTVACSGQVVDQPTTISSIGTLNGFFYINGLGPSLKQIINVSATGLSSPVTVHSTVNYEISLTGAENSFVSNGNTLLIENANGKVNAVPIYIRLKSGLNAGIYNSENIRLTATGADTVNVVCNGKVVVAPTIEAGPAGLDPTCPNQNITLTASGTGFANVTWIGPNGFYSTQQNPTLGIVTAANNGTYTVTGYSLSGVNLITNGDFELGNVDFGSSYTFREIGGTSNPYGVYWVKASPSDANSAYFLNTADHSPNGTLQMIVDGSETPGTVIWSQTISVSPNSDYLFSYFGQNVNNTSDTNYGKLQLYVNNIPYGAVNTLSVKAWVEYKANINVGNNSTIQLTLINTHIGGQGNDFAIDDIDFQQVVQISSSVTLNVVPTVAPALLVTASENPVFANTIVTYTATPTNGGTTPLYQWKVNGVNQGAPTTNKTFEYIPLQGDSISCVMTSNYECVSPQTASNFVKMTVNPRTNYWRGNISTDWGNPANWTGGYVPVAGDDVEFAKKSNNNGVAAERNLQLDINRTIGYLINDSSDLSVIIPPNLTLIVNNSIQSTSNPDKVIIQASSTLPNGSIVYRNSQSQPVFGTVEMYSPASWNKLGGFNNVYNWQFFGIPVTSVNALPTFYGAYVRELIESDKDTTTHWRSLKNESVLQPFIGYELCQQNPKFYTFKGQLVNSNYSSGQFIKTTDALYPGQHLFANPYTAAMDIKLIEFGVGVEATAYLYATGSFVQWRINKNNIKGAIPGQYFAVPKEQAGIPGIPRQVPSMGTLMVRIPPGAPSTELSYVNFNYNNIAMGNSERQRAKAASVVDNQATTTIDVEGENAADRMWIMSNDGYTRNFDNGFDGKKLIGNALSPQIYAVENDGIYQVNSVDDLNNTTLAFQAGQDTEYKMTFTHDENTQRKYKKLFLHDLLENKVIDVTLSGTEYSFSATTTTKPVIRFKVLSQSENVNSDKSSLTKVYHFDNQLYVQNFSEFSGKVYVYDISGRTVSIKSISANENIQISAPKNTTYIVKTVVGTITETTKVFLQ